MSWEPLGFILGILLASLSSPLTAILLSFWIYSLVLVKKKSLYSWESVQKNMHFRIYENVFILLLSTWWRIWLDSYFRLWNYFPQNSEGFVLFSFSFQLLGEIPNLSRFPVFYMWLSFGSLPKLLEYFHFPFLFEILQYCAL